MSKLKVLAGETALYGFGSIVPRMLNFLLVPLHTHQVFSPAEYGVFTQLMAFVAFINVVFTFGMETAFFRFANKSGADTKRIFNLAQTCVLVVSVPLSILFIGFATPIANIFSIGNKPEFIIWLTLIMLTDAVVAIPFAQLRLEKKPLQFSLFKIFNVMILLALNWYFLKIAYNPAINVGYIILANLIANSFFLLFLFKPLIAWRPAFDRAITPSMLQYAYPVMLTGVAGMTNEMFSRLTLEWWLPDHFYGTLSKQGALGVFGACYKYGVFMNLGIQAFRYAAEPFFFSNATDKSSPVLFARVNHYFVIVACIVFLSISINLDVFQLLIGSEFRAGITIVPILLMAYLLLGIYYNFSVWFKLTDKTFYGTVITLVGAFVTIAGNYFLIPILGFLGSSWAALLCYGLMALICFSLGQKTFPIPYKIWSMLGYLIITSALVYFVNLFAIDNRLLSMLVHLIIIFIYIGIVYWIEKPNWKQSEIL